MIKESQFIPANGLKNPHLQSLFPTFARRHLNVKRRRQRLELADGDFLDLDWIGDGDGPIVIILHGMAGSADSPYIKGIMQEILAHGWRGVLMYYRGCSGQPNRLPQTYHLGQTTDLNSLIHFLHKTYPQTKLSIVDYSMGGNILLKWLGEHPHQSYLQAAVAISAPYDLRAASAAIRQGKGKLYQWLLLRDLRRYIKKKYQYPHAPIDVDIVDQVKSFWDLDEKVTAPMNGFSSAVDYYHQASCGRWIPHITTPTLIIHATDDPMIPPATIPAAAAFPEPVTLELSSHGGHVGFVTGTVKKPIFWLDTRIPEFLTPHLTMNTSANKKGHVC